MKMTKSVWEPAIQQVLELVAEHQLEWHLDEQEYVITFHKDDEHLLTQQFYHPAQIVHGLNEALDENTIHI